MRKGLLLIYHPHNDLLLFPYTIFKANGEM
jgi:hypothetical protein